MCACLPLSFRLTLLAGLVLRVRWRLHLLAQGLQDDPAEALVEEAVDDKVHDGVEHQHQVVDRGQAQKPRGRPEVVAAEDHLRKRESKGL